MQDFCRKIENLTPLVNGIEIKYKIVSSEKTTSKRGEYCLFIYSEERLIKQEIHGGQGNEILKYINCR